MARLLPLTLAAVLAALAPLSATDHWPQFRGALAGVADDDPALPERWSETENVRWKTAVPGLGWSSPIVWGDHVFVTTAFSDGQEVAPIRGLCDPIGDHSRNKSAARHRWMLLDFDFDTGVGQKLAGIARDVAVAGDMVFVVVGAEQVAILRLGG